VSGRKNDRTRGKPARLGYRFSVAVWALFLLLHPAFVRGVTAQQKDDIEYKKLVSDGLAEFKAGRWDEAHALFEQAHATNPNARTLRGMGMAAFEARRYAAAIKAFEASLKHKKRPLTNAQRKQVDGWLKTAYRFVARYRFVLHPADATLTVDGNPAEVLESEELLLDAGKHEIEVANEGYRSVVRQLEVIAGTQRVFNIKLMPLSDSPETADRGTGSEDSQSDGLGLEPIRPEPLAGSGEADTGSLYPTLTWIAAGSAAAFGVATLIFGLRGEAQYDDLMKKCDSGCSEEQIEKEIDDSGVETSALLTNISIGLAGACLAGAVVFFVLDHTTEIQTENTAAVSGPGGVNVAWRF
jgi:hypothetical protein